MHALETLRLLLRDNGAWLSAAQVGARLQPESAEPSAVAVAAQRVGQVLAAIDGDNIWFPAFQFDASARRYADLDALLVVLPRERDRSLGLDAVLWMFQPDNALGGRTPAEIFPDDPPRVIALAKRRLFGSDADD